MTPHLSCRKTRNGPGRPRIPRRNTRSSARRQLDG
jgi:hypothetical protein